jgi:hypothetical protein
VLSARAAGFPLAFAVPGMGEQKGLRTLRVNFPPANPGSRLPPMRSRRLLVPEKRGNVASTCAQSLGPARSQSCRINVIVSSAFMVASVLIE